MKAYIDKSALVVEIDRWKEDARKGLSDYAEGVYDTYEKILSFLNTLEAKEVKEEPVSNDLEESSRHYLLNEHVSPLNDVFHQCDLKTEMLYHKDIENAFKAGAKWQKEQTIYKACNYLFSHMGLFVTFFDDDIVEDIERSEFIKKFRIAMEDKT